MSEADVYSFAPSQVLPMRRLLPCLLLLCLLAGCASLHSGACPPPPIVCPNCHEHCTCEVETVTETKTCFEVECEAICIPRVKFWWEDCCAPPACAKTRLVNVLVVKEYECERCAYKWTPVCCEQCAGRWRHE